jgi:nucleoid-associated protein YgaU
VGAGHRAGAATDPARNTASAGRTGAGVAARLREDVEADAPDTYRVQPGDSLWRIAARQLGAQATNEDTAREVNRLWELNQQRIGTGNPDLIFPGQTLRM